MTVEAALKKDPAWAIAFPNAGSSGKPWADPNATVIQSSWTADDQVLRAPNGLISAIYDAYNSHNTLELRPDDFWSAIMT